MADSERSHDPDDEIPDPTAEDRKVPELEAEDAAGPDQRDQEEPGPGTSSWEFWTQVVIEKGLPLAIQLLLIWNLVHGNGG